MNDFASSTSPAGVTLVVMKFGRTAMVKYNERPDDIAADNKPALLSDMMAGTLVPVDLASNAPPLISWTRQSSKPGENPDWRANITFVGADKRSYTAWQDRPGLPSSFADGFVIGQ